ncbi:hypothetical protein GLO73106DRAFT_00037520, partial [Gloeocapsa sp. PCC 73106]
MISPLVNPDEIIFPEGDFWSD